MERIGAWRKNDPFPGDHVIKPRLQGQGGCIADLNTDSAVSFHKQLCRERRAEADWIEASLSYAYQIDYNYYRLTRRGCGCTVEPCAVFVCTTVSDTKVQCYFTSTETVWLGTGNPHPRFNVVTFTGTVWSISDKKDTFKVERYVTSTGTVWSISDKKDRSKVQCYFTSIETIWLGTGSPDPLPLSHRSWALSDIKF